MVCYNKGIQYRQRCFLYDINMYNSYKSQRISKERLAQISLQELPLLFLFHFFSFLTDHLQVLSSKYMYKCATYKICIHTQVVN